MFRRLTDKKCIKCGSDVYRTSYCCMVGFVSFECENCHWMWSFVDSGDNSEDNNPERGYYKKKALNESPIEPYVPPHELNHQWKWLPVTKNNYRIEKHLQKKGKKTMQILLM